MKKLLTLFIILIIGVTLGAQSSELVFPENLSDTLSTVSDSVNVITEEIEIAIPDSTKIPPVYSPGDSLYIPTREDSLAAFAAADFEEKEDQDLEIKLDDVKQKIAEVITEYNDNRKQEIPFMYYQENYHNFWPLSADFNLRKYGFSKRNLATSNLQSWQNYLPDNLVRYNNGLLTVEKYNYDQLPLLTITNLVLGEDDLNHAMISMMKGSIFGFKDLNFALSYLGQEGLWLGDQEKSANFGGHLFYQKNWGTLHYYYNQIEQDLALRKININDDFVYNTTDYSKEKITEHAFRFDNRFVNIGYNFSKQEFNHEKQETRQYLVNKNLDFNHTQFDLSVEYLEEKLELEEDNYTILTVLHNSELGILETANNVQYIDENESSINSSTKVNFSKPAALLLKYSNFIEPRLDENSRFGGGVTLSSGSSELNLVGGIFQKNGFETNYIEADGKVVWPIKDYQFSYRFWAMAITDEQDFYPTIQTRNNLEFGWDLKRDNYLRIGLNQIFCQEFLQNSIETVGTNISEAFILDAYFAIQITKYFELQIDVKNLTSSNQLFSYGDEVEGIAGLHFNAGVSWIFLN